jgi:hypothetical protein
MQGGAIAGLLTAEIEALAEDSGWGAAVSVSAWFLRPTPLKKLRTRVAVVRAGGRVAVVDNTAWPSDEDDACATVRVTLMQPKSIELSLPISPRVEIALPHECVEIRRVAPHGGPWMMDGMQVRQGKDILWFRMHHALTERSGPLSNLMPIADWAHGIARPVQRIVADPNPNLTVQILRSSVDGWVGLRSYAKWEVARGVGVGGATLFDTLGEIGSVSMAVALKPFSAAASVKSAQ